MDDLGKIIISGKLRIVTPVHIGGAQEKHLQKGLDFIVENGKVYMLDERKLMSHFGINKYSDALVANTLIELCDSINLSHFSKKVISEISGEIGVDIKTSIKNTLSNKPIIPGSSLKGAIRSIIYNSAKEGTHRDERDVFGNISEDIFRYMIVNDIEFNQSNYINTKTFNLKNNGGQFAGGWKHELRSNTTDTFRSQGFTFAVESITIDDFSDFSMVLNSSSLALAVKNNGVKKSTKLNGIFTGTQESFFKMLQDYAAKYLQKELAFFTKYETDKSYLIIEQLKELIELNKDAPLIRLGLGSGFHAMTGDTIHASHYIDDIGIRNRGRNNYKDSSKSRKIAFSGYGDALKLYPMGFVQLMHEEYYNENYKNKVEQKLKLQAEKIETDKAEKEKAEIEFEAAQAQRKEEDRIRKEKELIDAEEALKPKMMETISLKKAKFVDGIVVGQDGVYLLFYPYIRGFENIIQKIRYPAGMPNDSIIQVMCSSPNGKMLQFQGAPKKKE